MGCTSSTGRPTGKEPLLSVACTDRPIVNHHTSEAQEGHVPPTPLQKNLQEARSPSPQRPTRSRSSSSSYIEDKENCSKPSGKQSVGASGPKTKKPQKPPTTAAVPAVAYDIIPPKQPAGSLPAPILKTSLPLPEPQDVSRSPQRGKADKFMEAKFFPTPVRKQTVNNTYYNRVAASVLVDSGSTEGGSDPPSLRRRKSVSFDEDQNTFNDHHTAWQTPNQSINSALDDEAILQEFVETFDLQSAKI